MKTMLLLGLLFWSATAAAAEPLLRREWTVDGVSREALVHLPAGAAAAPLVFVFHGHGGSMRNAARSFALHEHWPEAVVVYPQGLNTPGQLTDPEGRKPGWQSRPGDQGDRDLRFFDAMLAGLKREGRVDALRIYSTGHSNGGGFTYLLWAMRGDTFAAMAPSAAAAARSLPLLRPKPVLHLAGENDPLVKLAWQQATITALRRLNQCGEGRAWELDPRCTLHPSALGAPVVVALHPGGHEFHRDAPALIVKFLQSQQRRP